MTFDLSSLGWDDDFAADFAPYAGAGLRPARVTRVDRGVCVVLARSGPARVSVAGGLLNAALRNPVALPCSGDWVALRDWPDDRTTVEGVLPRRTAVVRSGAGRAAVGQVLAANLDTAAVVEPVDPAPDVGRIERLLTLAWQSGADPLVVLTKADLVADSAPLVAHLSRLAPGVPVLAVSAATGAGLDALQPHVAPGRTLGLLGRSGGGKSSLVNALAGATVMGTQEIRRSDGRGRHTTTYRALVPIPGGGAVLDTPGLRGVGLRDASDGLNRAFADVTALAQECEYDDCAHGGEPGCAVSAALASGELTARRWESWRRLHREIAVETRRGDARLVAQDRARWRRVQRDRSHR